MGFGIQTFDAAGHLTFSTEDRLFRYVGYKDLPIGSFKISVEGQGQAFFIPMLLTSNNPEIGHQVARSLDIPYLSARINGNVLSGEVKSPMSMWYKDGLAKKPLIRIYYGVY